MRNLTKCFQFLALSCSLATGCDATRFKTAVPDILSQAGIEKPSLCKAYQKKGRGIVEASWVEDWPVFQPIFQRPAPDPASDEKFCRSLIESRGAKIDLKPFKSHSSTSLRFIVLLHPNFHSWGDKRRAVIMCHEAAHIVRQKTVGVEESIEDYATISGRLASEAAPYALSDLQSRWYGTSAKKVASVRKARSESFPNDYKLSRTLSPKCVLEYFSRVSNELERRVVELGAVTLQK